LPAEPVLEVLGFNHQARERLAKRLQAAAGLGFKPGQVLAQVADTCAQVTLCAETLCLLLSHLSSDAEELQVELVAALLEACCVQRGAGLLWYHP
jgi:hypothetical protein